MAPIETTPMLKPSDFAQALGPAFVAYALVLASTGTAPRFAPAEARQAQERAPAALRRLRESLSLARTEAARPSELPRRSLAPLRIGLRVDAADCAGADAPAPASAPAAFAVRALAAMP